MNSSTALSLPSPRKQLYFLNPALSSVPPRQPRTGTALRTQTPHAAPAPAPEQPRTSRLLPPPPPGGARPGSRGQPAAPGAAAEAAGPAEGGIHLRSAGAVTPRHGPAASPEGATALPARSPRETPRSLPSPGEGGPRSARPSHRCQPSRPPAAASSASGALCAAERGRWEAGRERLGGPRSRLRAGPAPSTFRRRADGGARGGARAPLPPPVTPPCQRRRR